MLYFSILNVVKSALIHYLFGIHHEIHLCTKNID